MHSLEPGTLLASRYRIDGVIGRGGMSTVYRAFDTALDRTVAIKAFADAPDLDGDRRAAEVRALARLDHPALVTLFDAGSADGMAFSVMRFVDGEDLGVRIARGPLPPAEVSAIGASVAAGLTSVHASGIVHRDVKPANILLPSDPATGSPVALLADFGIARMDGDRTLTAVGTVIGTAAYLSPEQARGESAGPATDIYALALVLIEALTGTRSFPGSNVETVAARLSGSPAIPAGLGAQWAEVLTAMTHPDPAARPTAAEVAATLAVMPPVAAIGAVPDTGMATLPSIPAAPAEVVYPATRVMPVSDAATAAMPGTTVPDATVPDATVPDATVRLEEVGPEGVGAAGGERAVRSRRRRPVVIAVAAAIVAAAVVGGAVFAGSQNAPPASDTGVPTQQPTVAPVVDETAEPSPTPDTTSETPDTTETPGNGEGNGNGKKVGKEKKPKKNG